VTYPTGKVSENDFEVQTDCLRTGDRCVSLFHNEIGYEIMVFANGQWTRTQEDNATCSLGGTAHRKITATYPYPVTPQDPIIVLTGRGHVESTGSACVSNDFDAKFERTGD
jgi:serine/threonine-protein kinase